MHKNKMPIIKAFMIFKNRFMEDKLAGINHILIILGFILFLIAFLTSIIQVITNTLGNVIFLKGDFFNNITMLLNIGSTMMLLGSVSAILRRLSGKTPRLGKERKHMLPLFIFMFAALAGLLFEGFKSLLYETGTVHSFAGKLVSLPISAILGDWNGLRGAYLFSWYLLSAAAIILILSITQNKMLHMSAAMLNLMNKKDIGFGILSNQETQIIDFFSKNIELDEDIEFGTKYIENFDKSQLTQLDSCAECGRCDSVCPAYITNKKLSPQKMILANKESLNNYSGEKQTEIRNFGEIKEMVWECNMCYACEAACPSLIEHVDRISGIRRDFIMNSGETIPEFKKVIENMNKKENPFGIDNSARENLLKELSIPTMEKGKKVDYVLWLGCHAYFDPRM
jgi:heterodisulfide reductase subunit C